jgi:beta-barrel assembly-enhancing protease
MSGLFYNLGKMLGPTARKARWIWLSMTGTEAEAIRIEGEVGKELAREIRHQLKTAPDPRLSHLLNEVGSKLAGYVANESRRFSFEIFEAGQPNAFALPGGYIFVTRSLIELCEYNRDEIAFILGHEMGHVIRGHAMDRIITNSAITIGANITSIRGPLSAWLSTIGINLLQSTYSQELELEADNLGARLAVAAGFSAKAPQVLLSRLANLNPADESSNPGHYFSSHPAINLRIQKINQLLHES